MSKIQAAARLRQDATAANNRPIHTHSVPYLTEQANTVHSVNSVKQEWGVITPLLSDSLPSFPTEVFPDWLRHYVEAVAESTQTPCDLSAMLTLSVGALCVAGKARIVLPRWEEPLNLFTVTALPPGSRKSAVFAAITAPVTAYERECNTGIGEAVTEAEAKRDILKSRLDQAKRKAVQAPNAGARLAAESDVKALARELDALRVPVPLRLIADDCTPERLAGLLAEQGGRIGLFSSEGDLFQQMAGRYSDKGNLAVYLKGHAGDELRVDRIGRPAEYIASPCLTVGLAVQPEALRGLMTNREFRGRGLLGRFLYALPVSNLGFRETSNRSVPDDVTTAYRQGILRLFLLEPDKADDGTPRPHALRLSAEAQAVFDTHHARLEPLLRPGERLGGMTDWGGKLLGALARIAGILHLAETNDPARPVAAETLQRALSLQDFLITHARAVYAEMGTNAAMEGARVLLDWIRRTERRQFTKRDAHRDLQGRFQKAADLDAPLVLLCERNYVRQAATEGHTGAGRPPSPQYEVHPALTELTELTEFREVTEETVSACMALTDDEEDASEQIARARIAKHDGRRKQSEDYGEVENYHKERIGAKGERLAYRYLRDATIQHKSAPDIADCTPEGDDLTLLPSGIVVGVKTSLPGADGLSVNNDTLRRSDASWFWPVRFLTPDMALLYAPVPRAQLEAAAMRTGRNGSLFRFLPWDDLCLLPDAEPLRQLAEARESRQEVKTAWIEEF